MIDFVRQADALGLADVQRIFRSDLFSALMDKYSSEVLLEVFFITLVRGVGVVCPAQRAVSLVAYALPVHPRDRAYVCAPSTFSDVCSKAVR